MNKVLLIFVGILGISCNSSNVGYVQEGILKNIEPTEAKALIDSNKKNPEFIILDVRRPSEFSTGHIENAKNLDYYSPDFRKNLGGLEKEKQYLVYCRSGKRSANSLEIMRQLDFKKVYNLLGGMIRWKSEGFPVTR